MTSNPYRFPLDDKDAWLRHLREKGYVVLTGVVSSEEVKIAKDFLWKDLQSGKGVGPTSAEEWDFVPDHGIVASLAQTAGPWQIRGNTKVQEAFSHIWATKDLITSMDAVLLWPGNRKPSTEGLHLDQNPFTKPNLDVIQGMVPLLPVTSETGGLEVVPYSHTPEAKKQQSLDHPNWERYGDDFCLVDKSHYPDSSSRLLLECGAGDLILWDSRTIHGGRVGTGSYNSPGGLVRMSVTVAMTPRAFANAEVQKIRREGFEEGASFNHCPHEAGTSTGTFHSMRMENSLRFQLTESQAAVL